MISLPHDRFTRRCLIFATLAAPFCANAGDRDLLDTTRSPSARMYMTDLADVRWTRGFWAERFETARTTMVPHMESILV